MGACAKDWVERLSRTKAVAANIRSAFFMVHPPWLTLSCANLSEPARQVKHLWAAAARALRVSADQQLRQLGEPVTALARRDVGGQAGHLCGEGRHVGDPDRVREKSEHGL